MYATTVHVHVYYIAVHVLVQYTIISNHMYMYYMHSVFFLYLQCTCLCIFFMYIVHVGRLFGRKRERFGLVAPLMFTPGAMTWSVCILARHWKVSQP